MSTLPDPNSVKVYTVNGAASSSSSSLPDWLTRKRAVKEKGKRAVREQIEGTLELLQHFEFPEASNKIKVTKDGHHAVATGTYKPQMRVWDLDQLSLKFERHSDAENVDFLMLSDDWTKSIHLQNDRSIELHAQGGLHYRTRIPKFGRALGYHFPSCDALIAGAGSEVYRLNLDQGRFMQPLQLQDDGDDIPGVNAININPAHQLFAFGIEGNGTVQFWDPRSRNRVGLLQLPLSRLLPTNRSAVSTLPGIEGASGPSVSATAIASRLDGLSYAIGTSTGHTLLYDIRSPRPSAIKDQGYGLPVKVVSWMEGGSRMAGDGLVLSADKKVIKIWDRHSPSTNFTSITPANDVNDVCHIPGTGLLMLANEGIQMTTYYIPQLGPAPKWCSFLENLTEEMEDQTMRTAYQDYKFVERNELASLGLDHLIGTPALKPYMHGYFLSLQLYDTARLIANPYVYEEHREKMVQEKMDKMAETRIRARKDAGVKVNKALAEKIRKEEEREKKRAERKKTKTVIAEDEMDVDDEEGDEGGKEVKGAASLLSDPRFKDLFENPEFEVDQQSREFALLNPSTVAQRQNQIDATGRRGKTKTAVEEEEEESDKASSDGLSSSEDSENEGKDGPSQSESESEDSDAAGELWTDDIRARMAARSTYRSSKRKAPQQSRNPNVRLVPLQAHANGRDRLDKNATFGQRRTTSSSAVDGSRNGKGKGKMRDSEDVHFAEDGGMEVSFMPSGKSDHDDDMGGKANSKGKARRGKGVETFGASLEKGGDGPEVEISESERKGRTHRRKGMRSGSKNTFRRM
ncbi:WD40-repeat-containing domain protein [Irpex rosettiformis]|uniref:WD40-repeat-containing domain protein n=1 Tax=Irpex rosettiformis TaxID=378272 RepID=A0ACB8TRW1_9APHY|nr:WD40-repeat-containing domain protein [Irpex rosettiformis]